MFLFAVDLIADSYDVRALWPLPSDSGCGQWLGRLLPGLQLLNSSTTPEFCRAKCCDDPNCEVWQWGNTRENSGAKLGKCSTGRGLECQSERFDDFLVLAGQRISHGTVSETIQLEKGRWCRGIGMKQADVRAVSAVGTYKAEVLQCRDVCYGDSGCSIWEHSTQANHDSRIVSTFLKPA